MKPISRLAARLFVKPFLSLYLSGKRSYRYPSVRLIIFPGVFHPGFFFSTKYLLHHLLQLGIKGKKVLELGAGSGLISFVAESRGALVTASEISSTAIHGLQHNKASLNSSVTIIQSDLFDHLAVQPFDFIVINPPYYPGHPSNDQQLAWYCGENHQYFEKLFRQLPDYFFPQTKIIMVLSDECDMQRIQQLAGLQGLQLNEKNRKRFWWEWNYIFEITLIRKNTGSESVN